MTIPEVERVSDDIRTHITLFTRTLDVTDRRRENHLRLVTVDGKKRDTGRNGKDTTDQTDHSYMETTILKVIRL